MANLTNLQEYKTFAEVGNSAQDARLSLLVTLVSGLVETYCNRTFSIDQYVEIVGYSDGVLFSRNMPLKTIVLVEYLDAGKTWTTVEDTEYELWEHEGAIELFSSFVTFPHTSRPYRITTTAGYTTIPADLKLAALDLITYYHKREAIPLKSSGNVTVNTVDVEGSNFPPHIKRILDLYRLI